MIKFVYTFMIILNDFPHIINKEYVSLNTFLSLRSTPGCDELKFPWVLGGIVCV